MATAVQSSSAILSMDEYLATYYRPDREYIDGCLQEKSVGGPKQGLIQMQLGIWFFQHSDWGLRAIAELRTKVTPSRVRLPDVAVVQDDSLLLEEPRVRPPFIAIEILSPADRIVRAIPRLEDFLQMQIPNVWLIDPADRSVYTYSAGGLKLVEGKLLTIENSPVYLDLQFLFSAIPEQSS